MAHEGLQGFALIAPTDAGANRDAPDQYVPDRATKMNTAMIPQAIRYRRATGVMVSSCRGSVSGLSAFERALQCPPDGRFAAIVFTRQLRHGFAGREDRISVTIGKMVYPQFARPVND